MKLSKCLFVVMCAIALCACQVQQPSINAEAAYSQDSAYIGKQYVVTKDQVFMGIRDQLADGQSVTVLQTFRTAQGLLLIKVADTSGKVIFDKPYSFGDLGLVDEIGDPVQTSVDEAKVRKGVLGKQQHGYGKKLFSESYSYTSTVENTKLDGFVAHGEHRRDGLGVVCSKGTLFLTVSQSDIIAAPNSTVSYKIYVDRRPVHEVQGLMINYSSLASKPPTELVQDLLHGREGVLRISTLTNSRTVHFRLDGFAEMYTRVLNNCSN